MHSSTVHVNHEWGPGDRLPTLHGQVTILGFYQGFGPNEAWMYTLRFTQHEFGGERIARYDACGSRSATTTKAWRCSF